MTAVSYQVFARKYRPQTFEEVVGQDHITRTLRNAIGQNRLAHAYLFVGPRGIGKTSTARILAKALNCKTGPTITPCGVCDSCKEITSGISLDVLEIDGASNNGVEQVRELRDNVRFAPAHAQFKIYIIDEVHMLTTQAFNALLKTLEEPPEHVKFIFATTDVQKVLPTILSRCQRFDLRRIPADLIAGHMLKIADAENIALEDRAAMAVARGADGGLRDAESMLDQLVAFCGGKITEEDVLTVFGFTNIEHLSALTDALLDADTQNTLRLLEEHVDTGRDLGRLLGDLIGHLRNLLICKVNPDSAGDDPTSRERIQVQSQRVTQERLLELIDLFAGADGKMKWASNKKLHFEVALIKACEILKQSTLDEVIQTLLALRDGKAPPELPKAPTPAPSRAAETPAFPKPLISDTPLPKAPPEKPPVPDAVQKPVDPPEPENAPEPVPAHEEVEEETLSFQSLDETPSKEPEPAEQPSVESIESAESVPTSAATPEVADLDPELLFKELRAMVEKDRPLLSSWISSAQPLRFHKGKLTLGFAPSEKLACDGLSRSNHKDFLQKRLSEIAGTDVLLDLKLDATLSPAVKESSRGPNDPISDEEFRNDPKIKIALERFSGQIAKIDRGS